MSRRNDIEHKPFELISPQTKTPTPTKMSTFNSSTTTPNFDNLLLQSLLNRLQLHPPPPPTTAPTTTSTSFDEFLSSLSDNNSDDENYSDYDYDGTIDEDEDEDGDGDEESNRRMRKSRLSKEESRLEKEIIKVILSGKTDTLKPNSGQAVSICDHHVCVGFHQDDVGSGYRVWEWHGHVMLFDDLLGYSPEYIYGNYFERVVVGAKRTPDDKPENEKVNESGDLGLKGLIHGGCDGDGGNGTRVVHRSRNAGATRDLKDTSEKWAN